MSKKNSGSLFLKINNQLITEGVNTHLSVEELYVYAFLLQGEDRRGQVITTIGTIHEYAKVKFGTREDNATNKIRNILIGLKDKKIIKILDSNGIEVKELKANSRIAVVFSKLKENGHVQVSYGLFEAFETAMDFYIYALTARWDNAGGFSCSYDRWADLLKVTRRTAIRAVNLVIAKGIIYKNIGDYRDNEDGSQKYQDINTYRIRPFPESEKTNMTKNKDIEEAIRKFHKEHEYSNSPIHHIDLNSGITRFETRKNEHGIDLYPIEEDYVFYMEVKEATANRKMTSLERKFLFVANTRITDLMKNDNTKFKQVWDRAAKIHNDNR